MKPIYALSVFLLCHMLLSCSKMINTDGWNTGLSNSASTANSGFNPPALKIAVVSDIHYMHPSLLVNGGGSGAAFQAYLDQDPKLVQYSASIFRSVLADLKNEHPDILLVPGDITKDGEKIGHQAMAAYFEELRSQGTKVFVVPGNHDINNAKAKIYDGNNASPVEMTTKQEFADIYRNFGYLDAVSRDPNSLSYIAPLTTGIMLLAIDASRYDEYGPSGDMAAGRIKPETLSWILTQMALAKANGQTVFAMMHHNLIEHYSNQSQLDPGYVVDDWQNVTAKLMDAGLRTIFTGHYHANDVTSFTRNGSQLFDIETGSLVTAPCPYRIITMKNKNLDISSRTVESIDVSLPGGLSIQQYANTFLTQHLDGYFNYYLANQLGAPAPLASVAAPLFRNGIMAHFAGDEKMPPDQRKQIDDLAAVSQQLAGIVTILWTDVNEKDNKINIAY